MGSEAVICSGSGSDEEATIGGIYHGTSAVGVGEAGREKMSEAGVIETDKQDDLFDRIAWANGWFPSETEQAFCETFREKLA